MLNGPYSESLEPNSLNVRNLRNLSRSKYSPLFTFSIAVRAKRRVAIQLERLGQPAEASGPVGHGWPRLRQSGISRPSSSMLNDRSSGLGSLLPSVSFFVGRAGSVGRALILLPFSDFGVSSEVPCLQALPTLPTLPTLSL